MGAGVCADHHSDLPPPQAERRPLIPQPQPALLDRVRSEQPANQPLLGSPSGGVLCLQALGVESGSDRLVEMPRSLQRKDGKGRKHFILNFHPILSRNRSSVGWFDPKPSRVKPDVKEPTVSDQLRFPCSLFQIWGAEKPKAASSCLVLVLGTLTQKISADRFRQAANGENALQTHEQCKL